MALIHRAATCWIRRSHIIPQRRSVSTLTRSTHYSAISSVELQMKIMKSDVIDTGNKRNRITQCRPKFHQFEHRAHQTRRSMVMVTQTISSSSDEEVKDSPTSQQQTENILEAIDGDTATLNITASCAARIKQLASTRPNPDSIYLRLYVDAGGCSGFQYKFLLLSEDTTGDSDTDDEEDGTIDPEEDIILIKDGMRVVIDQTSLDLLRGSTIDYVQEMIRSSFAVVGNPQSESACGCGSSFAVKNFESNPALD